MPSADDQYESQNDAVAQGVPAGDAQDNDYVSSTGQKQGPIPVQSDGAEVEDPINADTADSDQQLADDDRDAIDQSNILGSRTRHAKPSDGYREPGDEEGLPGADDGTSSGRQ
ncbi:hypothetical protein LHYA1_G002187 [Lachnellula hyalina]|uniref:Histone chaperone domain-containing protein n=1 Tax=Lachnellula hyalina TaxID=1316788 RepID=A0A8H8R8L1_9HELO|nr:uncharacterized protein LHYA1_G002187 [Lachnellula hyalina]TVY28789.1 hypothetical protein LHYA1_G002187 [Lachnellula hyalina]